jgi:prepilin-type N-terminal cleavage/methylation domain-containing protein
MKQKGYTLIELLAVLSIMAVILLIAVPSITKQLSTIEDNKYKQFKQNVFLATESYINASKKSNTSYDSTLYSEDTYNTIKEDGNQVCVMVYCLVKTGWIKSSFNNPKTKSAIDLDSSVIVKNNNGEYEYTYQPNKVCTGVNVATGEYKCGES